MMQRRSYAILATCAALLFAAAYVLTRPQEAGMRRLDTTFLQPAKLDRIEVGGAHKVVLHREGEVWLLPNGRPANASQVKDALHKLASVNTSDFLGDDPSHFAELGVSGEAAIAVRASAGDEVKLALVLGRPAPDAQEGTSVRVGHVCRGEQVFAETAGLLAAFDRDADAWEDRDFLQEGEDEIAELQVRLHGRPAYAVRRGETGWQLEPTLDGAPVVGPKRFDPQQVAQLVSRLATSRAQALVDEDPGAEVTGLGDDAADKLSWHLTSAGAGRLGREGRALWLGRAHTNGGVWARAEGRPLPFVVEAGVAEGLRREVHHLAELSLMAPVDVEQAKAFVLEAGSGQRTKFVKKGEAWQVAVGAGLPKGFVLDPHKLKARMRQAMLARAVGLVAGVDPKKARALAQGGGRVVLTLADNSEHVLQFGRETPWSGTSAYYAKGDADGQLYLASRPLRQNLLENLGALGQSTRPQASAGGQAGGPGGPLQGLDSLPPEVQESIRRQLAGQGATP